MVSLVYYGALLVTFMCCRCKKAPKTPTWFSKERVFFFLKISFIVWNAHQSVSGTVMDWKPVQDLPSLTSISTWSRTGLKRFLENTWMNIIHWVNTSSLEQTSLSISTKHENTSFVSMVAIVTLVYSLTVTAKLECLTFSLNWQLTS